LRELLPLLRRDLHPETSGLRRGFVDHDEDVGLVPPGDDREHVEGCPFPARESIELVHGAVLRVDREVEPAPPDVLYQTVVLLDGRLVPGPPREESHVDIDAGDPGPGKGVHHLEEHIEGHAADGHLVSEEEVRAERDGFVLSWLETTDQVVQRAVHEGQIGLLADGGGRLGRSLRRRAGGAILGGRTFGRGMFGSAMLASGAVGGGMFGGPRDGQKSRHRGHQHTHQGPSWHSDLLVSR
jgi:hypothetical protein